MTDLTKKESAYFMASAIAGLADYARDFSVLG
jgi:hypothetical protein